MILENLYQYGILVFLRGTTTRLPASMSLISAYKMYFVDSVRRKKEPNADFMGELFFFLITSLFSRVYVSSRYCH